MKIHFIVTLVFATMIGSSPSAILQAQESSPSPSTPKAIPTNRIEMLDALDLLKHRQARLPLPPAPAEANSADSPAPSASNRGRSSMGVVNNGRMRNLYLPAELRTRRSRTSAAADRSLPYDFSTELFWIVSRINNCHYCLGHQEHKLKAVGLTEPTLLALDTDWSAFPEKRQAAFAFTRQLTLAPQTITDRDIEALQAHFSDEQILDIAYTVGRYNSTNRWTDSLGIPQEEHRDYDSALDPEVAKAPSQVTPDGFPSRRALDDFATWKAEFDTQAAREPRLVLASQKPADGMPADEMLAHEQLLAELPAAGPEFVQQLRHARTVGELPEQLRDRIAYVAAREDQAWYMQHLSRQRLLAQGLSEEEIFQLTAPRPDLDAEGAALQFAIKLTSQPQSMTDQDIQQLAEFYSPEQIAEIVYHTGLAAILDRVTEVARLGW